ncbi:MAG: T9SS type A sorting domain-containing protein [Bacteroidales bacterium]|nr:T9SS type A sorting domain-containing protein [Bacteroidales bacterium]
MKKHIFIILFFCLPFMAVGQDNENRDNPYWTEIVTSQPEGYVVLENGDVEISSAEGLAWLISVVNGLNGCEPYSFEGHKVRLMVDVPMCGDSMNFTPIGNRNHCFMGEFNGMGHRIERLTLYADGEDKTDLGLFGYLQHAIVRNLVLKDAALILYPYKGSQSDQTWYSGSVAGVSDSLSLVENCFFISCTGDNGVGGGGVIGGIVGRNRNSTVKNCGYFSTGYNYLFGIGGGGIVGENVCEESISDAIVANCYFIGKVMPKVVTDYGGIVCYNETTAEANEYKAIVENCYAYVDITESYKLNRDSNWRDGYNGHIIAVNTERSVAYNCFALAPGTYFCGLFGHNDGDAINCSGFEQNGMECLLDIPVTIGGQEASTLLDALNLWIIEQDDPTQYRNWVYDEIGLPEFEDSNYDVPESNLSALEMLLYPNPTEDFICIDGVDVAEVTVYDMLGQLIKIIQNANEINLEGLPQGIYTLRIADERGFVVTKKVIKK